MPSILTISVLPLIGKMVIPRSRREASRNHTSKLRMLGSASSGVMQDVIPIIMQMLNMLEPMMFPTEISSSFFMAAIIDVVSSGRLVPMATTVTAITLSLTPNDKAMFLAP